MLATIPVMLVVVILTFLLIHLSPGDPAVQIAGDSAIAADIAKLHASLGLDQPLWQQFFQWAWQIKKGNIGTSLFTRMPVSALLTSRLDPPLSIGAIPILLAVVAGISVGVVAASRAAT